MSTSNGGTITGGNRSPERRTATTSQSPSDPRTMSSDFHREYASALNDVGFLLHRAKAASTSTRSSSTLGATTMSDDCPSHEEEEEERALLYFQRAVQIRLTDLAPENDGDVDGDTRIVKDEMRRDYEYLLEKENQLMLHLLEVAQEACEGNCYHMNGNEPLDMYDMVPTAIDIGRVVGDELRSLDELHRRFKQHPFSGISQQQ